MSNRITVILVSVIVVVACIGILAVGFIFAGPALGLARVSATPAAGPTSIQPGTSQPATVLPPSTPTSIATVSATSTPPITNPTLDELTNLPVPRNDPIQLGERLKHEAGAVATPASPVIHKIGDQASFSVLRDQSGVHEQVQATLRYLTPHAYLWVENGLEVSDSDLKTAGDTFESKIYPTDRGYFGSEPNPGVDNDPHVYILNTFFSGAIGYFWSPDEFPKFINPYSNEHEMFYMNVKSLRPGTDSYSSVLAHEFTHMIHYNENPREGSWITEGLGELAMKLNGWPQSPTSFGTAPDTQLNAWTNNPNLSGPYYAGASMFLNYLLNRFGDKMLRDVISSGTHDIASVQTALDKNAPGLKFDDVFADWVAANFADNPKLGNRYSYLGGPLVRKAQEQITSYPKSAEETVHQYGTRYIDLTPQGKDVTFTFDGSAQVKIVPTDPHSGQSMWWGNRVDESDATLTRAFDLTNVNKATLNFWTWYDIEAGFDYAYVEVSGDEGKTWTMLSGGTTTNENPNGNNYGVGLTCRSVAGCTEDNPAQWVQEQLDLSAYAGKKILVRFEYVTDGEYTGAGFAIDDISIPEIGFSDDAEKGDNGWQAQGFGRIDNRLPQRYIVQAIEYGADGQVSQIVPVPLDRNNHGTLTLSGFGKTISRVVIAISGATPITWEQATYKFSVQ